MKSTTNGTTKKQAFSAAQLALYALFAALLCILAPLSVPIGPIPISLTNLVLYFSIFLIEAKGALISYAVYLLIGMAGLPVFSGYIGGLAKIAGPTGGYLVGFLPMLLIMGFFRQHFRQKRTGIAVGMTFLGMILGTIVAYLLGTIWFVLQMGCDWGYALTVCVFPFIPFDIAKMVIAILLGGNIRKALMAQGLLNGSRH